ncbi:MAG TPA: hypothetical protein VK766_11275 [Cytophagaceae bacterium]|jgi:hypothetical protein|nr:hypothetical protein [Cytophagaceae bacterium]
MNKKITKYVIIAIVILLAELLSAFFFLVMDKYKSQEMPYRSTAIHMLTSLIIYYPIVTFLDGFLKSGSKNLIKSTQKATKNHLAGLLLAFAGAFFLIWMALVKIWYNRNIMEDIGNWIEKTL